VLAFGAIPRFGRRELFAVAVLAILILAFLPIVVRKAVWLGQGDVEVFFRAGWAIWSGYPLYQVFDHHGWTYHYPPALRSSWGSSPTRCRVTRSRGGRCPIRPRSRFGT
jgi:hypothetical protein